MYSFVYLFIQFIIDWLVECMWNWSRDFRWSHWQWLRVQYVVLFIIVFIVSIFAHTALSLIQYDRQALLDVRASIDTNFFSDYQRTSCKPIVLPPLCCQRKKKRGKRAGILWQSWTRFHNLPIPSILLTNVQSLDNKMDKLNAHINFQWDTVNCCMMPFTETWLDPTVGPTRFGHCPSWFPHLLAGQDKGVR